MTKSEIIFTLQSIVTHVFGILTGWFLHAIYVLLSKKGDIQ